jgi:hypothetical protein
MTYSKPFISINRIASLLGVHHVTARAFLATLPLKSIRIGRRDLYRTVEVMPRLESLLR